MGNRKSKDGSIYVTDEIFNSVSHLAGTIFSLLGLVMLIVKSSIQGKVWHIVSFSIYGFSFFFVFLASSLHHGIKSTRKIEAVLKLIDYLAIFPLIAGTFTPICLILFRNPFGWSIFGVVWALAVVGIVLKLIFPDIPKWVTGTLYICMGWIGVVLAFPFYSITGSLGLGLLLLGAFFYTTGFIIYNLEKPNIIPGKFGFHEIWHIFVLFGGFSHFFMMYLTILPK